MYDPAVILGRQRYDHDLGQVHSRAPDFGVQPLQAPKLTTKPSFQGGPSQAKVGHHSNTTTL